MASRIVSFGVFTLDPETRELFKRGTPVKLQDQCFEVLCLLLERPNQIVTRDELRARLWPDTYVAFDMALNTSIRKIRRALGDTAENPIFIETLPKRGYRFVAPVIHAAADKAPPEDPAASSQPGPPVRRERELALARPLRLIFILAAIGILSYGSWALATRIVRPEPQRISIAVLPFANLSGDPALEYLSDGIAESLIDSLSDIRSLRVMAPGTTFRFKGREVDPRVAGHELKVAAVVQGKLYRQGNILIVDANLVDATSGVEVWRRHYRRSPADALDLEQEISRDLAASVWKPAAPSPVQLAHRTTRSKEAYQDYLRGLYEMRQLSSNASQAVQHFEHAVTLDPSFALAWVGLGSAWQVLDDWVLPPAETIPRARAALVKALDLDPSLSEAHGIMATVHFWYDFDQSAAEAEFRRALELNPSYDDAHDYYGWFLVSHKRFDEGLAEHRRALELSPYDLEHHLGLSQSLYYSRHFDEAFDELRSTLLQNPNAWWGHELLGWVYEQKGDMQRSVVELKRAVELEPNIAEPLASLGRVYAVGGDRPAALKILNRLKELAGHRHVSRYALAILYAGLGQDEQAVVELGKAYEEHSWTVTIVGLDPKLDRVRSDPRVKRLLRQAGLP